MNYSFLDFDLRNLPYTLRAHSEYFSKRKLCDKGKRSFHPKTARIMQLSNYAKQKMTHFYPENGDFLTNFSRAWPTAKARPI